MLALLEPLLLIDPPSAGPGEEPLNFFAGTDSAFNFLAKLRAGLSTTLTKSISSSSLSGKFCSRITVNTNVNNCYAWFLTIISSHSAPIHIVSINKSFLFLVVINLDKYYCCAHFFKQSSSVFIRKHVYSLTLEVLKLLFLTIYFLIFVKRQSKTWSLTESKLFCMK